MLLFSGRRHCFPVGHCRILTTPHTAAALAGDAVNNLVAIGDVPVDRRGDIEVAFNGKAAEKFNVDLANSIKATAGWNFSLCNVC